MKIKIEHLIKTYEKQVVLDDISFEDDIHTLALIGSSGGGKSTLLRILGGLIPMTLGRIEIGETIITGKDEPDKRKRISYKSLLEYRRKIGFVFQQDGLLKHLDMMENITMPLTKVHGYTKEKAEERAEELLERFGLKEEAHKYVNALSGGQRQRAAIVRAIAPGPEFLLLDEPTSALDPEYTGEVLNVINELKQENMDFIIVTHEMGFARQACEKTMFLQNGKIGEYGDSSQLFQNPESRELRNFLRMVLQWNKE